MPDLKKYQYTLKTLSPLIISPRESNAYYLKKQDAIRVGKNDIQIIYPFYQYGAYEYYDPEQTQYYIPGSSIKGGFKSNRDIPDDATSLLVDDIGVNREDITLGALKKLQHIPTKERTMAQQKTQKTRKAMKLEDFFPNVAVEMLMSGRNYSGELYCNGDIRFMIKQAEEQTRKKLNDFLVRLNEIFTMDKKEVSGEALEIEYGTLEMLSGVKQKINDLLLQSSDQTSHHCRLIIGGHKGKILSGITSDQEPGSIYLDSDVNLPYGLVDLYFASEVF